MKKIISVTLTIVLIFTLTACQNQPMLSQRLLITGIGIDVLENGEYSAIIHAMRVDMGQNDEVTLLKSQGKSVLDALNNVTLQVGKTPLYSHNLIVVFGHECAVQGLNEVLDFFVRHNESRPTVDVFLSQSSAEDILSAKKDDKYILTKEIDSLSDTSHLNGKTAKVRIVDVINMSYRGGSIYLPELKAEEDGISITGTGIFFQNKFSDSLNEDETRGFLLITQKLKGGNAVIEVEGDKRVTLTLFGATSKIGVEIKQEIPIFKIQIGVEAYISSIDGNLLADIGEEYYQIFEKELAEQMRADAQKAINKAILKNKSDIFNFGRRLKQDYPDYWKEHQKEWENLMKEATYEIEVKTKITRVGQEITPGLQDIV